MRLVLKRLPAMLATLLVVSFLTFLLTSLLPGDPAVQILGAEAASDPEVARGGAGGAAPRRPAPVRGTGRGCPTSPPATSAARTAPGRR